MFTRIVQYIEHQAGLHRALLSLWRRFPPRLAGFLKGDTDTQLGARCSGRHNG